MDEMTGFWTITIISWIVGLAISFFLVRMAVRANEQINLLKEISDKQTKIIEALTVKAELPTQKVAKSDDDYLEEARKRAGN
ncbi:YebO family protein [Serratia liquefaciens]|uniref:YebO family protein n=1 Tax=Serratia liquefaciens TaxID=614 RepID=UPI001F182A9D|nr:YebO family protein [Serratia liquefaciens]MCE9941636.1 YebO family protein [Serratia liquefaciens]